MGETIDTAPEQRRAVLVAVVRERQDERQANEYLDELEFLAETAGIRSVKRFTQRLAAPSAKTFIGEGKLAEIAAFVEENEIRYVIFDDELSPSQLRNLDKVFKNKIYDRTSLILDIFVQRATTAYAKAQVELAQCQYLLPRLAGMWTHLERQRGGTGTRGGAGEREIETDTIRQLLSLGGGTASLNEILLPEDFAFAGKSIKDIPIPGNAILVSITRDTEFIIPHGNTVLLPWDRILCLTQDDTLHLLTDAWGLTGK